jgi:kynurenine 3-monooxygenase
MDQRPYAQDKSFTLTLFAHDSTFTSLTAQLAATPADSSSNPIVDLFRAEFPDALKHMGEEALLQSWRENPKDGLVTVEVRRFPLSRLLGWRYSLAVKHC